jgi:predicted metal-dependent peptidase
MQFDCEKTEDPKPYDRRKMSLNFLGRGGTNFQPVIDIVNAKKYKGVMILTDGEASAPTKPLSAQVLWVLPADKRPPVEWGDRVYLVRHV